MPHDSRESIRRQEEDADPPGPPRAGGAGFEPGEQVGHFRIIRPIGRGGMGEVYLAEDERELRRQVALKFLPREFAADRAYMQRFRQEARTASTLNHPNILTVYEFDHAGPDYFIATEYVEGVTLREKMRVGRVGAREAVALAAQMADALAAAHARGVVHRDVKPENVMVRSDGYVKVLDFGIAKPGTDAGARGREDPEAATELLLKTTPGAVFGTVSYMSPEQSRGRAVDARTDVWSLGVVLYEMLAGRLPFDGADVHRRVIAIQEQEPPALSSAGVAAPARLEGVVRKALAKDPAARYQTAREMLADLKEVGRQWESGAAGDAATRAPAADAAGARHEVAAAPAPARLTRRRAALAASAGALVLLLLAGAAYRLAAPGASIDSIAVLPLANAGADPEVEYLADGLTENLINSLSQLPHLKVMARTSVFRYKGQEADPQEVGRRLGVRAALVGHVVQHGEALKLSLALVDTRDGSHLWGLNYDSRLADMPALQTEITRDITEKLRLRLSGSEQAQAAKSYTADAEAYRLYLKGRFHFNKLTEAETRQGIDYFNQAVARDPSYALAYAGLANAYILLGANYSPPHETYPKASFYARRALELDDALAEAHYATAVVRYAYDWDWAEAEREARRAQELNPNYADAYGLLGRVRLMQGQTEAAVAQLRRALELDPLSLLTNYYLGYAYYCARRHEQAGEQYRKTLEIEPRASFVEAAVCKEYALEGRHDEALAACQRAAAASGGDDPAVLSSLGVAHAAAGRQAEALRVAETLQQMAGRTYVRPYDIIAVYAALGRRDETIALLEKAFDERSFILVVKVDPAFDKIRPDPRYRALLERMRLLP